MENKYDDISDDENPESKILGDVACLRRAAVAVPAVRLEIDKTVSRNGCHVMAESLGPELTVVVLSGPNIPNSMLWTLPENSPNIKELYIKSKNTTDYGLKAISRKFLNLEKLSLNCTSITDIGVSEIITRLPKLRTVCLVNHGRFLNSSSFGTWLAYLNGVTSLTLVDFEVSSSLLAALSVRTKLEELVLVKREGECDKITINEAILPSLKSLQIIGPNYVCDFDNMCDGYYRVKPPFKNMEKLVLRLVVADIKNITFMMGLFPNLKYLDLSNNEVVINKFDYHTEAEKYFNEDGSFNTGLCHNDQYCVDSDVTLKYSVDGIIYQVSSHCDKLEVLNLSFNDIGYMMLPLHELATSNSAQTLRVIILDGTSVCNNTVKYLIEQCKKLELISIKECSEINKKKLPTCTKPFIRV